MFPSFWSNGEPGPVFLALKDLIQNEWTTSGDARTDDNGEIRFRGFAAEYDFLMNCLGKDFRARFHAAAAKENIFEMVVSGE